MYNYTVYKVTNLLNGKLYFGITKQPIKKRWIQHKCNSTRKGYHLYNAMLKYGIDRFTIDVVKICESELEMYELEKQLISKFNTTNPEYGYNNSTGGELSTKGSKRTEEQKQRISEYQQGRKRKPHSEKAKVNMSIAAKGRDMSIQVANSARLRMGKPAHNKTPVFSTDKDGCIVKYDSITEASRATGILISSIVNNLSNKSKTAGGLIWDYQQQN